MKTLILIRHAKSSWSEPGLSDFDRPLNERGKKDAPEMAKRLSETIKLDHLVSSPAKRAKRTARFFAEEFGIKKEDIQLMEDLYMATQEGFLKSISAIDDKYEAVALFSHNPGISEFAASLTEVKVDDMPTCAMFALAAETVSWKNFEEAPKKFLFFDYPKKIS